ncbi:ribokinase [Rubrobacter xylanophilus]|uniref:Ribokinase n=1 Tax=Rubrobacter xylanophilus TaxID=49319 RepID=A0A510HQ38_9ACTN|nr:sugar kinase [Rubrobacter xylanophilus]BBL81027.1 ribokinase [Rubrobacter xylanophilus]
MSAPRAVVVGDVLYDMVARIEGELPIGDDSFVPIRDAPGGSAANVAAWLAILGVETHLVGRVGDDPVGEHLEAGLREAGVRTHLFRDASLPTGKVFVLVDGSGERTMITDRGAGEALGLQDLPLELFASGGHLHLTGYLFSGGSRRAVALEALRLARRASMSVSVDPSSVTLLRAVGPERFLRWTAGADLAFPNLAEGALLSGRKEPEEVFRVLLGHYRAVVLKLGPEGALYAGRDGARERQTAPRVARPDATGAGDALCAGFLAARLRGRPPAEALRMGVRLASRIAGHTGARGFHAGRGPC